MNFGFNSNVPVGNTTYHVQTEDRGPSHPFLDTVVYLAGRVVYKRSTGYQQYVQGVKPESLAERLHELLSQQHRAVVAELESGTLAFHTTESREYTEEKGRSKDGFDLRLLNPKNWFADGEVTFQIALFDRLSKSGVEGAEILASLEKKKQRTPCARARTDSKGRATLQFLLPPGAGEGASLVLWASDGKRKGELRFRLKAKPDGKAPVASLP